MDKFTLRLIIPGMFFTIVGQLMLLSDEYRTVGIYTTIAGPLALGLGIYLLDDVPAPVES